MLRASRRNWTLVYRAFGGLWKPDWLTPVTARILRMLAGLSA